jgi:hypothetical protein
MLGQLDMARHPELGLGLLLVAMAVLTVTVIAAAPDGIALVPLMTADGIDNPRLVVLFVQFGKHLSPSLQP